MTLLYFVQDLFFRVRNRIRAKLRQSRVFRDGSTHLLESDSQNRFYVRCVEKINNSEKKFRKFRRLYDYREILEHVDRDLGKSYIDHVKAVEPGILNLMTSFKQIDTVGKPRRFSFPELGLVSPTTLRYISVATDLRQLFGTQKLGRVAEIGGGYGGQAAILYKTNGFDSYSIYDLEEVQQLIYRFLAEQEIFGVDFPSLKNTSENDFDLVISNYAFSELQQDLQEVYLHKVLLRARNGFLIMNSGRTNTTGRSHGKISLEALKSYIPTLQVMEEVPFTGPDNYVIYWKESR